MSQNEKELLKEYEEQQELEVQSEETVNVSEDDVAQESISEEVLADDDVGSAPIADIVTESTEEVETPNIEIGGLAEEVDNPDEEVQESEPSVDGTVQAANDALLNAATADEEERVSIEEAAEKAVDGIKEILVNDSVKFAEKLQEQVTKVTSEKFDADGKIAEAVNSAVESAIENTMEETKMAKTNASKEEKKIVKEAKAKAKAAEKSIKKAEKTAKKEAKAADKAHKAEMKAADRENEKQKSFQQHLNDFSKGAHIADSINCKVKGMLNSIDASVINHDKKVIAKKEADIEKRTSKITDRTKIMSQLAAKWEEYVKLEEETRPDPQPAMARA
jgi:hypothetical protein